MTSTVALAGNAFITSAAAGATEVINSNGLANWTGASTIISIFFHMGAAGSAALALDARLAGSTTSTVRATVSGSSFDATLSGNTVVTYALGTISVTSPGYVRVDLQGISKVGGYFGDVSALRVTTSVALHYATDPANFGFARRGPSVHLRFTVPAQTEYFYNEVTVPAGEDKVGSYFMANGFDGGYFGIQVNSATERRVLFSVWDADSGTKTTLVRKGPGVVDNTFDGEGTGGQAYLVYNWRAGTTYRFLTRAQPDGSGATDFSAWFYAPEAGAWRVIAVWKRPETATRLTGVYSFLENFIADNGHLERRGVYGNQWARAVAGVWSEVTSARFTGDETASQGWRMDYAGGLEAGSFYLRNCGFFSPNVALNQTFTRPSVGIPPSVDVGALP